MTNTWPSTVKGINKAHLRNVTDITWQFIYCKDRSFVSTDSTDLNET